MGNAAKGKRADMKQLLAIIFILVAFIAPINLISQNKDAFFAKGYANSYNMLGEAYNSSQYVKKENPGIVPDETFEAFVAGAFIRGVNPIHIVHEHPPLGRYIIGLSIIFFDNASTITIPLLFLSLLGVFLIGRLLFSQSLLALVPVALFANEPLFGGQLRFAPHLEPVQLPFIIFALYFFMKATSSNRFFVWFLLVSIMLGFVISIRFFILGGALAGSMLLYFLIQRQFDKRFLTFLLTLPLSLVVLVLSYTKTIQEGYSIWQIFGVQKYIFFYHQSKFVNPLSFWDLLLFNRWHTWWGDRAIISDPQWSILWPIATILTVVFLVMIFIKKQRISKDEKIIFLWVGVYSILLSIGTSTTRYFLALVPFLYILSLDFAKNFLKERKLRNS